MVKESFISFFLPTIKLCFDKLKAHPSTILRTSANCHRSAHQLLQRQLEKPHHSHPKQLQSEALLGTLTQTHAIQKKQWAIAILKP